MADASKESLNSLSATESLAKATNYFALNLHKLLAKGGGNVFFSPFSISTALAMLYSGTRGETAEEMGLTLGYDHAGISRESVKSGFELIFKAIEENPGSYTLNSANALLAQHDFPIKEAYKTDLAKSFQALIEEVDFVTDTQSVMTRVNTWVSEKTNRMIPKLLDDVDPATVMILLNAVYFKGKWSRQFKPASTTKELFYNKGLGSSAKKIQMMHLTKKFPYTEAEFFKVLQLPYKGEDLAMLLMLPHEKNGLGKLEDYLTVEKIKEVMTKLWMPEVEVSLPKFRMEYSKSLGDVIQELGIRRAFQRGAEFDDISLSKNLAVSEIMHKAVLEVNEEGSEAAAATSVGIMLCSMPIYQEFNADHPFLFLIYDKRNDFVLFMGRVEELD